MSEPYFSSAKQLFEIENSEECFFTGEREFDRIFGTGIPPATFLEVVGCSSTGKTQLCMQFCIFAQKRKTRKGAVYIDTEGGFSTRRLNEIAKERFGEAPENLLKLIKHTRCTDLVQLMSAVHRLQALLEKTPEIGLVVVDSIAMPFRGESDYTKSAITSISSILSRIAVSFRCLVVVVNHVTTRFRLEDGIGSSHLSSALGSSWSQRPCIRVWLCPPKKEGLPYNFHLIKSPFSPSGFVDYVIKMKFLAVLADQGATDTFSKIAETVSKLCKDHVVLRISRDVFAFVSAEHNHASGSFFEISLNINEFFCTLTMAGVSEEFDEIFMEIDKDSFYSSINQKEQTTKLRLTKIGNLPHLKVEQKTLGVMHEMPVDIIPPRQWKQYKTPSITGIKVAVYLPSLTTLRNLLTSLKNMGVRHVAFQGNQRGELYLNGDVDAVSTQIYFSGLVNATVDDPDEDLNTFHEVRVNVKEVHVFFRSINTNFTLSKVLLKIAPDKMAAFCIQQDDASLIYGISAVIT